MWRGADWGDGWGGVGGYSQWGDRFGCGEGKGCMDREGQEGRGGGLWSMGYEGEVEGKEVGFVGEGFEVGLEVGLQSCWIWLGKMDFGDVEEYSDTEQTLLDALSSSKS